MRKQTTSDLIQNTPSENLSSRKTHIIQDENKGDGLKYNQNTLGWIYDVPLKTSSFLFFSILHLYIHRDGNLLVERVIEGQDRVS